MTDPTPPQPYGANPAEQPPLVPPAAPAYAPPSYPPSPYGNGPVQPSPGAPPIMPYGYGGYGGYAAPRPTNGLAVASLVLSILGLVWILPVIGSIAGVIMGHSSLRQIAQRGEGGRGMAMAGTIIGWIGIGLSVLGVIFFVSLIAIAAEGGTRI